MSDTEIIIHLLRNVERRLRANRLLHELALGLSIVLGLLIVLKVWDLISPLRATTIRMAIAACGVSFMGYVAWCLRKRGSLDQAAVSIDSRAGLKDEIKTAFWFIKNPRSSEWVDRQIQRAARNVRKIDLSGAYPRIIPRRCYTAAAMILAFTGLNFAPLPMNHNWLVLQAAPDLRPEETGSLNVVRRLAALDRRNLDAALDEIAAHFLESERLRPVAEALIERRLDLAAEELRRLGAQLSSVSLQSTGDIQDALRAAAANSRPGLEPLAEDLAQIADALRNKNVSAFQEAIEQVAGDFDGLDEEIYKQESTLDQLASGNERRAEQDGRVGGAPIPEGRDFAQETSSAQGFGASGGKVEDGPRQGEATTLAVKLQQEALKGMLSADATRVDVEEASRQERSKLDYRNVKSELTAAQKDALNQENLPWRYRPLIKNYFQAVVEPVTK